LSFILRFGFFFYLHPHDVSKIIQRDVQHKQLNSAGTILKLNKIQVGNNNQ